MGINIEHFKFNKFRKSSFALITTVFAFLLSSCGSNSADNSSGGGRSFKTESSYCSNVQSISGGVTITSKAQFYARTVTTSGLTGISAAKDIKHAEVAVVDSAGNTVQCSETDSSGNISLVIPNNPGNYTLKVYSRADNSHLKISVLNSPYEVTPYSISAGFSISSGETSKSVTLTAASYKDSTVGGAFNIFDQVLNANDYIRNNSSCGSFANCSTFTVMPKVRVFWSPGISPYEFINDTSSDDSSTISMYYTSSNSNLNGLYIGGGANNSLCSDTDHFDNSVILHEYGHFIESIYKTTDSPGGYHNGNFVVDPRLAWSEGWGNFFQAAVLGTTTYYDTTRNSDCDNGTSLIVALDLETAAQEQDKMPQTYGSYNNPSPSSGEGIYREISVSRMLIDTMNSKGVNGVSGADGVGANLGFTYIWHALTNNVFGMATTSNHFKNAGLFNSVVNSLVGSYNASAQTDYNSVLSNEYHVASTAQYGQRWTPQSSSCSSSISGSNNAFTRISSGVYSYHHMHQSSDFITFYHDGSLSSLTLNYSGSPAADLDLYLLSEDYAIDQFDGTYYSVAASSAKTYPESGSSGVETVSLSGIAAGWYMIEVRVKTEVTANKTRSSSYYISTSAGNRLCP